MSNVIQIKALRRSSIVEINGVLLALAMRLAAVIGNAAELDLDAEAKSSIMQGLVTAADGLCHASRAMERGVRRSASSGEVVGGS